MARKRRILETHVSDPYYGRDAKLYKLMLPDGDGWEVVLLDGRWKTYVLDDYEEAYDDLMHYIQTGHARGFYTNKVRQEAMWDTRHPGASLMRELLPKKNPSLGTMLLVGGAILGVGALLWKKFGPTTTTTTTTTPVTTLPPPGTTPPSASPSDLAPPSDGGVIDVQGLGYYSTNRRNRIRRIPNR